MYYGISFKASKLIDDSVKSRSQSQVTKRQNVFRNMYVLKLCINCVFSVICAHVHGMMDASWKLQLQVEVTIYTSFVELESVKYDAPM